MLFDVEIITLHIEADNSLSYVSESYLACRRLHGRLKQAAPQKQCLLREPAIRPIAQRSKQWGLRALQEGAFEGSGQQMVSTGLFDGLAALVLLLIALLGGPSFACACHPNV